jgi:hypothetical protein
MALAPGGENPSAAYLAGQQHGAALAVQHHANPPAKVAPKPAAAPVRAKSAAAPTTLNSILAAARQMAAADTNAQVGTLTSQQDLLNQQGRDRAAQITAASQAAAKFLAGLGDNTASSYNNAATTLAGIAGGYNGALQGTAQDAASQIQQQLAGLGAPADSLKTATGQTPQPAALGNVLYGLGGAIPANLLVTSGQAAAAAQRGLPAATLGYGQQQAGGALASAQQQADQLIPQIEALKAGQPKLVQQYLTSIQSQLTNTALANSLIGSRASSAKTARINAITNKTYKGTIAQIAQQQANIAQQRANAYTNHLASVGQTPTAGEKPSVGITRQINDGFLHTANGAKAMLNGQPIKVAKIPVKAPKGPTVTAQKWTAEAFGMARNYHQPWIGKDAKTHPPLRWSEWLTLGLKNKVPLAYLMKQGRRIYTPDEIRNDSQPGYTPGG